MKIEHAVEREETFAREDPWMCSGFVDDDPRAEGRKMSNWYHTYLNWFKLFMEVLLAGFDIGFLAFGLVVLSQRTEFYVGVEALFFIAYACFVWGFAWGYRSHEKEEEYYGENC